MVEAVRATAPAAAVRRPGRSGGRSGGARGAAVAAAASAAGRACARRGPLVPTIAILVAVIVLVAILAQLWTEVLWFDSVGFATVFRVELITKVAAVHRRRPASPPALVGLQPGHRLPHPPDLRRRSPTEQQNLDHYREALEPLRRVAMVVAPALLGLLAGSAAAGQWQTFLLWRNGVPFGTKDPQFGIDLGFFVFTLPWLRFVVGFLTMVARHRR